MVYNIIRKVKRTNKVPTQHNTYRKKEVIKMFATIITIIIAVPVLMNVIGYDWEDVKDWFANGRISL
jgi:hypothetical protein